MLDPLPDDLFNNVLQNWLSVVELGKIDTANCNVKSRVQLLQALSANSFTLQSNKGYTSKHVFTWIMLRKLKLVNCFLSGIIEGLLSLVDVSKIIHLDFSNFMIRYETLTAENVVVQFVNSCVGIKSLKVADENVPCENFTSFLNFKTLVFLDTIQVWGSYSQGAYYTTKKFDSFQSFRFIYVH